MELTNCSDKQKIYKSNGYSIIIRNESYILEPPSITVKIDTSAQPPEIGTLKPPIIVHNENNIELQPILSIKMEQIDTYIHMLQLAKETCQEIKIHYNQLINFS